MKILKIKMTNFKQFKDENEISFNTNGKLTVIYGFNGFGKTRLHTFFHWLLYGEDRDNEKIYNTPAMNKLLPDSELEVKGEMEFEHNNDHYILIRKDEFRKTKKRIFSNHSAIKLRKFDENGNPRMVQKPNKVIESIVPKELSKYFLFDGEGMVSELLGKKANTDQYKTLKSAVNTLFGLQLYENTINDLTGGSRNNVVYELTKLMKDIGQHKPSTLNKIISHNKGLIEQKVEERKKKKKEIENLTNENNGLSEKIGNSTNKNNLERERKMLIKENERSDQLIENKIKETGKFTTKRLSYVLVAKNIVNSKEIISKKVDEHYVAGLNRELINNLLSKGKCLCDNDINETEEKKLNKLLKLLPPHSYRSIFLDYKKSAERKLNNHDLTFSDLEEKLIDISSLRTKISDNEERIDEIDDIISDISHLQPLVNKRKENENTIQILQDKIQTLNTEIGRRNSIITGTKKRLKSATKNDKHNSLLSEKIDFIEEIGKKLEEELTENKIIYKNNLEKNIVDLTDMMLSVNRKIKLLDNYSISIKDDTNNTSLSAGQAAIVSFSYIGGVLNSLKEMDVKYVSKEYPLILDAPLSHLDEYHIERVFEYLPEFSNQIIIFSKEKIDSLIPKDDLQYRYQINSNENANIAKINKYQGHDYFSNKESRMLSYEI